MDMSLQAMIERADGFLQKREGLRAAMSQDPACRIALLDEYRDLAGEEGFARVRAAGTPMLPLLRFLATFAQEWDLRELSLELSSRLRAARIAVAGQTFSFAEARRQLSQEPERLLREGLERGLDRLSWDLRGLSAERYRRAVETAHRLGFERYSEFEQATEITSSALQDQDVTLFLRRTHDAYRDLMDYALKKVGAEWKSAQLHDARWAVCATWLDSSFRREDILPVWSGWLDAWGLGFRADGCIEPEFNLAKLEGTAPKVAALQVPQRIKLLAPPLHGLSGYGALLERTGRAQHLAHLDAKRPLLERRMVDPSALAASGRLFEALLSDQGWLRRAAGIPAHAAKDAAKMAALRSLFYARRDCALWRYQSEVWTHGPEDKRVESYQSQMRGALGCEVPPGNFLRDAEERQETAARLVGAASAAHASDVLKTRFDQDYWRNPAAGVWLHQQWNLTQSIEGIALTRAGDQWVDVLNA
jgi:hypothetical protein